MSIVNFKNLLMSFALIWSITASAAENISIDLLVNFPEGGSVHRHSMMIAESLTDAGYTVNVVNTGNCINHVRHLNNNKNSPAIYLYADSTHNEFAATGCVPLVNDKTYLTTAYYRVNAMCTAKSRASNADMVSNLIKNQSTVTVSAVTSTPTRVIESMSEWIEKPVKMVPYSKSSDAIRGVLGGDADFLYIGLTPAVSNNSELFCWATTNKTAIDSMVPLQTIAPNYQYNTIGSYWFIQAHALSDAQRDRIRQDLDSIFAQDKWINFFKSANMVPGKEFKNITAVDILQNINNLK